MLPLAFEFIFARCRFSDIGIIISNMGVQMFGIQQLLIFPAKGGCSNGSELLDSLWQHACMLHHKQLTYPLGN